MQSVQEITFGITFNILFLFIIIFIIFLKKTFWGEIIYFLFVW